MTKIAMLGAGAMGSRVAINFIKTGHDVTIYNRSPNRLSELKQAGAKIAISPKDAAKDAEIVIAMVRDNEASEAVWLHENGAIQTLSENMIAVEMSTLAPNWVKKLADKIKSATGAQFLEAPVLGTRPQAEAAKLIYLIGGETSTLERARHIFESTSCAIHYIGEFGQASTIKLAVNSQYGVQVAIWAETLALLDKQGIAKDRAVEIINTLPTTAAAMQLVGNFIVEEKHTPMFPIDLVEKDFAYANYC